MVFRETIQAHSAIAAVLTSFDIYFLLESFLASSPSAVCSLVCRAWKNALGHNVTALKPGYFCASINLVKWYEKIVAIKHPRFCEIAAASRNLGLLRWLHVNNYSWDYQTCLVAAQSGHFGCLRYAHENGCELYPGTYLVAAAKGHLACFKYAYNVINSKSKRNSSCGGPHKINPEVVQRAAEGGHIACLRYAHEKILVATHLYPNYPYVGGTPRPEREFKRQVALGAVRGGNAACLGFIRVNGYPWTVELCSYAAFMGNLDVLKSLHENGCPWSLWACARAAEWGRLDCLKYLHENGCEWANWTCSLAAFNKHLDCLRYAHENGCEWDGCKGCSKATLSGHTDSAS